MNSRCFEVTNYLSEDVSISAMLTDSPKRVLCVQRGVHVGETVIQKEGPGVPLTILDKINRFLNKFV